MGIVAAAVIGLLLITFGNSASNKTNQTTSAANKEKSEYDIITYSELVEKKIKKLCEQAYGVGDVSVAVTLESGYEYVYAVNSNKSANDTSIKESQEYLIIKNGTQESAVYLTGKPPKIKGVGIVCVGGGDPNVQINLINLISAGFDVSKNNIYVGEAKSSYKK